MKKAVLPLTLFLLFGWSASVTARDAPASPGETGVRPAPAVAECATPELADLFGPEPTDLSGCSASYLCIHGGSVSCSSPLAGTCVSSGAGCGRVACNGTWTRCPGYCYGDHQCARFCLETYNSFDGACDEFGCCECY